MKDQMAIHKLKLLSFIKFALLSLLTCFSTIQAANQDEESFFTKSSVSNQHINSFSEDKFGYMWIATAKGLCRYNGYEYVHYYNVQGKKNSLPSDFITNLYLDKEKQLWITTDKGVCRYNYETNDFSACHYTDPAYKQPFEYGIIEIDHRLLVYGFNGIKEIDKKKLQITRFSQSSSFIVTTVIQDDYAQVWTGGRIGHGISFSKDNLSTFEKVQIPPSVEIYCSYKNTNGEIWFGTNRGILAVDPVSKKVIHSKALEKESTFLADLRITAIHSVDSASLLLGTEDKGLFLFHPSSGKITKASEQNFFVENKSLQITCCYTDSKRNLWLGTFDKGYFLHPNMSNGFNKYGALSSLLDGVFVTRIAESASGNLWIGTRYHGFLYFNHQTKKIKVYNLSNFEPLKNSNNNLIQSLFVDSKDNLWIGYNKTLVHCIINGERIVSYQVFPATSDIVSMAEDNNKRLWVGSDSDGITIYDIQQTRKPIRLKLNNRSWNNITHIIRLKSNEMLYSAYDDGIYVINPQTFQKRPLSANKKFFSFSDRAIFLFENDNSDLWIGTYGKGVVQYSPSTDSFIAYSPKDGLASNDVLSIVKDKKQNLWLSTSYGISDFNLKTKTFFNYYAIDGIGGDQFHEKSVLQSRSGEIYFGGNHGITYFSPEDITMQKTSIPVILEDLKILNISEKIGSKNKILSKQLSLTESITLNHKQNIFSIDYAGIDFNSSEKINYAYRLVDFDKDWNYVNNYRRAGYSNLPAGKYTFEVKAQNADGTWDSTPTKLRIEVKAAPWLTMPAITMYIIIILLLGYLAISVYIRMKLDAERIALIEKERLNEKEMNEMKIRFFTNISHELRTPLSMIYGPIKSLLVKKESPQQTAYLLQLVNSNVEYLLRLINQLLDFEKMQSDSLTLSISKTDIIDLTEKLVNSFFYFAQEKKIKIELSLPKSPLIIPVDADAFNKIMSNLLTNALKYTPENGHVTVDICLTDHADDSFKLKTPSSHYLLVKVIDDGIGMNPSDLAHLFERYQRFNGKDISFKTVSGKGIGLNYAKRLVEEHKGAIQAKLGEEKGMIFSFIIPTDEKIYNIPGLEPNIDIVQPIKDSDVIKIPQPVTTEKRDPSKTVLIVEDNAPLLLFLSDLLTSDYTILTAEDGEIGYEKAKEENIDLILSDVLMPNMDGYTFCGKIKNDPELCHIPFIILTAKVMDQNLVEGYRQGADVYLNKPFNPLVLIEIIKNVFANIERRKSSILQGTIAYEQEKQKEEKETEENDLLLLNPLDEKFLKKLHEYIDRHLSDCELNVTVLGKELGFSRTNFYRKIKALTGYSPNDYLRIYRLNKAAEYLLREEFSINEISDMTGFSSHSHFSNTFKKHFGVSPKEYKDK